VKSFHRHRDDCRLCGSPVALAVPLRPIPVRTANVGSGAPGLEEATAPLDLYRCPSCGHLQLCDIVDPSLQYREFRYRTSISVGLPEHFAAMARELCDGLGLEPGSRVLEIGSNDGTLLRAFQGLGMSVLGVDPARRIAEQATNEGIPTRAEFFTVATAQRLAAELGRFDLVVANNTLANLDDLDDVAAGVRMVLADEGVFVVETSHGAAVLEHTLIDTVYHEHLSYFLVEPLERWFAEQGLELFHAEKIATKGGSLRLFAQQRGASRRRRDSVEHLIEEERRAGLGSPQAFERFSSELENVRRALAALVRERAPLGSIAAYGASVGTTTLLHQFDLGKQLAFVVDDDPLVDSIDGPGYSLPVVGPDRLVEEPPSLVVVLAHRYADAITERCSAYLEAGGQLAVPLPRLRVVEGVRS